ncbi:uncharacterized protein FOMMEDRAFT_29602 [Fomitiporia mediterranea MF3/22]|uniref:uncharacterized protein n=1 Tax=Fomitiporia mediterranea (strain MF3/22) TaxID=694068 RepID=UPI00044099BA|nr:uncharacterized protein FOMMEDRAFT_29602 [Fomitiporia mediterranea MF3/22]EJD00772.1 hypothetical protein FOMMEDRAFT_29602 [Fomitiporia mediterranea MF3/22]
MTTLTNVSIARQEIDRVYDWLVSLSDEYDLIWCTKWNLGKALYLLTRYLAFVDMSFVLGFLFHSGLSIKETDNLLLKACRATLTVTVTSIAIGNLVANAIVLLRVYALYGGARYMSIIILFILILGFGVICTTQTLLYKDIIWQYRLQATDIVPCPVTEKLHDFCFLEYVWQLIVEVVLQGAAFLVLYKGIGQWMYPNLNITGMLAFICMSTLAFANAVLVAQSGDFRTLLLELHRVVHTVITSRMILNMREVSRMLEHQDDDVLPPSQLVFASSPAEE